MAFVADEEVVVVVVLDADEVVDTELDEEVDADVVAVVVLDADEVVDTELDEEVGPPAVSS